MFIPKIFITLFSLKLFAHTAAKRKKTNTANIAK